MPGIAIRVSPFLPYSDCRGLPTADHGLTPLAFLSGTADCESGARVYLSFAARSTKRFAGVFATWEATESTPAPWARLVASYDTI
jgi:hypothetical protein